MPTLNWPTKSIKDIVPADLVVDSAVFPQGYGYPGTKPKNRLIWGDNLEVMAALLPEYEGKLDLIYADPPFFTNKRYPARIGRDEDSRKPLEWKLAEGYGDNWEGLDAYLDFLYPRLAAMHRLLSNDGTLYLHLDWHADACARLLLDELFGREALINEIIWAYHGPSPIRRAFNRKHDTILMYAKGDRYTFNGEAVREPYHPNTIKTFESSGKAGFGKIPDLERGKIPEDWWYFPVVARLHRERTGYPTQKPEALLERIILASSNPGDLVADFFCGSGTTPFVAAQLDRSYLACDTTWRAINTTRSRLTETWQPFLVQYAANFTIPTANEEIKVYIEGGKVKLPATPELDYWEVDPDWDGVTFRSTCQACRPKRSGKIPREIKLPAEARNVCVRAVFVDGRQIQLHVQPVSHPPDGL